MIRLFLALSLSLSLSLFADSDERRSAAAVSTSSVTTACTTCQEATLPDDGSQVAAIVNGRRILLSEIDSLAAAELNPLKDRIYQIRKRNLDNLIAKILFDQEAEKQGKSAEEARQDLLREVKVESSEIDEAYSSSVSKFGTPPLSEIEAKEKIRATLESRKRLEALHLAINKLMESANVKICLPEPLPEKPEITATGPSRGDKGAPVTIILFSDFQCPYCKQINATLDEVMEHHPDKVRLLYKHLPLPSHPQSRPAARAAFCAAEQGKFWEFHDRIYAGPVTLSAGVLRNHAQTVGLDLAQFDACVSSPRSEAGVRADMREAQLAGISATPTLLINGRVFRGEKSVEALKKEVAQELAKVGAK